MKRINILLFVICLFFQTGFCNPYFIPKARNLIDKYETIGNNLSRSIVIDSISMTKEQIYGKFLTIIGEIYNNPEKLITTKDNINGSVIFKPSYKVYDTAFAQIYANLQVRLDAKEGRARVQIIALDYRQIVPSNHSDINRYVALLPPFLILDDSIPGKNKENKKNIMVTNMYSNAFIKLDEKIDAIFACFENLLRKESDDNNW